MIWILFQLSRSQTTDLMQIVVQLLMMPQMADAVNLELSWVVNLQIKEVDYAESSTWQQTVTRRSVKDKKLLRHKLEVEEI